MVDSYHCDAAVLAVLLSMSKGLYGPTYIFYVGASLNLQTFSVMLSVL